MQNNAKTLVITAVLIASIGFVSNVQAKIQKASAAEPSKNNVRSELTKWDALELLSKGSIEKGTKIDATYSEEELNGFIEGALASKNVSWFLDDASIKINEESIDFSGRMLKPIKGTLLVSASISLENETPVIEVHSAKYGIFRVPASFVERVGNFILKKKSMNEWLAVKNATWKDFSIKDGSVHIKVVGE